MRDAPNERAPPHEKSPDESAPLSTLVDRLRDRGVHGRTQIRVWLAATVGGVSIAARAKGLTKIYGSGSAVVTALDHVDFDVTKGEFTAIMGPSGSGKSTLMHLMAALDTPTEGEVWIGDTGVGSLSDTALTVLRRDRVGFIFQAFNLVPTLTARENIVLPLVIAGQRVDDAWFDQVIGVLGLEDRLTHKPSELSGGQQQRVACARALMNRPDIVFGDEPTGNLDSTSAAEVLGFLRHSVDAFGQTVVMVTHDALAASYADRAVFLSDGRIVDEIRGASQSDLLQAMARLYPRSDLAGRDQLASAEGVYRDGGAAPSHRGAPDDEDESTVERSIARRAAQG